MNVVIIPAFNESARIAKTVMAVQALPEIDAVLVVDDASSDATADIAERVGADVARAKRNRGKGGKRVANGCAGHGDLPSLS